MQQGVARTVRSVATGRSGRSASSSVVRSSRATGTSIAGTPRLAWTPAVRVPSSATDQELCTRHLSTTASASSSSSLWLKYSTSSSKGLSGTSFLDRSAHRPPGLSPTHSSCAAPRSSPSSPSTAGYSTTSVRGFGSASEVANQESRPAASSLGDGKQLQGDAPRFKVSKETRRKIAEGGGKNGLSNGESSNGNGAAQKMGTNGASSTGAAAGVSSSSSSGSPREGSSSTVAEGEPPHSAAVSYDYGSKRRTQARKALREYLSPQGVKASFSFCSVKAKDYAITVAGTVGKYTKIVANGFLKLARDPGVAKIWWKDTKHAVQHFIEWNKQGFGLLMANVKLAKRLMRKKFRGHQLSYRDRKMLVRTLADMGKLIPFSVFIIVPFAEVFLPFALYLFPNLMPSTFLERGERNESMVKTLKAKKELAVFFQEVVDETTKEAIFQASTETEEGLTLEETKAEFNAFQAKLEAHEFPTAQEVLRFSRMFGQWFTFENLPEEKLRIMADILGVDDTALFRSHLNIRLRHHVNRLRREDREILFEGVESLSREDLIDLCRARAIPFTADVSVESMREGLTSWLQLSSHRSIPVSVLLWIQTYYLSGKGKLAEEEILTSVQQQEKELEKTRKEAATSSEGSAEKNIADVLLHVTELPPDMSHAVAEKGSDLATSTAASGAAVSPPAGGTTAEAGNKTAASTPTRPRSAVQEALLASASPEEREAAKRDAQAEAERAQEMAERLQRTKELEDECRRIDEENQKRRMSELIEPDYEAEILDSVGHENFAELADAQPGSPEEQLRRKQSLDDHLLADSGKEVLLERMDRQESEMRTLRRIIDKQADLLHSQLNSLAALREAVAVTSAAGSSEADAVTDRTQQLERVLLDQKFRIHEAVAQFSTGLRSVESEYQKWERKRSLRGNVAAATVSRSSARAHDSVPSYSGMMSGSGGAGSGKSNSSSLHGLSVEEQVAVELQNLKKHGGQTLPPIAETPAASEDDSAAAFKATAVAAVTNGGTGKK
ncbi:unnamed protein product [Amoebophrya sp. A120]|nr:unnamed protein product [Amoebophrya sp. A120]|eukprot:GSA120T00002160001.1